MTQAGQRDLWHRRAGRPVRGVVLLLIALVCLVSAGCGSGDSLTVPPGPTAAAAGGYSKVLVVVEENRAYNDIIGSSDAPFINRLAEQFGTATHYQAGYPAACPSLAAYILLTSGSDQRICDNDSPATHALPGDNLLQQVAASGRQWRVYAEAMPAPCTMATTGTYLVHHTIAPYYLSERSRCRQWDVPLGSLTGGALHDAVTTGTLPALSLVIPDACDDMHGGHGCPDDGVISRGDTWLKQWLQAVAAGPDYQAGRLVVIVTWDESSSDTDNHIPTVVMSPTTTHVAASTPQTHCSTLHMIEDVLHLSPLGCAASTPSSTPAFHL